jgi:hypothetical protein
MLPVSIGHGRARDRLTSPDRQATLSTGVGVSEKVWLYSNIYLEGDHVTLVGRYAVNAKILRCYHMSLLCVEF